MDLQLKNKNFLIGGAGSGFGRAISEHLIAEGAKVIVCSRTKEKLLELKNLAPDQVDILVGDITSNAGLEKINNRIKNICIHGALINAGGPPALSFLETKIEDWDNAYHQLLRWKVELTKLIITKMLGNRFGRMLFIESISVKQPVENLVLSNSLRMAVVGFVKTLSNEIAGNDVTLNILAPGYHETAALIRLFRKKSELTGITNDEAKKSFESKVPAGFLGDPNDLASLAIWLLSPHSRFINGQTISVDGGSINYVFG
jgi:3-oxoacyl-[acyl-carrier protein] reductase